MSVINVTVVLAMAWKVIVILLQVAEQVAETGLGPQEAQLPKTDLKQNTECFTDFYTFEEEEEEE